MLNDIKYYIDPVWAAYTPNAFGLVNRDHRPQPWPARGQTVSLELCKSQ